MNCVSRAGSLAASVALIALAAACSDDNEGRSGAGTDTPPPVSSPPPAPQPPRTADLEGTWTFSDSLEKASTSLSCLDSGVVSLNATGFGEMRMIGSCRDTAARQRVSQRDYMTMTTLDGTVEFKLQLVFRSDYSSTRTLCTYRGTLSGMPVTGASGTVSCDDETQGTWTLARGSPVSQPLPLFLAVDLGHPNGCALALDGRLFCWGTNHFGQLGTGDTRPALAPVHSAAGFTFSKVSLSRGGGFACALSSAGKAYCWGNRMGGRMGDGLEGTDLEIETMPVAVAGDHAFVDIAAGNNHACGLESDGTVYCWGSNDSGQLGVGDFDSRLAPAPVAGDIRFTSIAANHSITCAIAASGDAYCWGGNGWSGVHGDGTTDDSNVPTLVQGGLSFASISVSGWNACGVTTGNEAYCWGSNWSGELGIGTTEGNQLEPARVLGEHAWKSVTAGSGVACGVTTDGLGYCWGSNNEGERGDGPAPFDRMPRPEPGLVHGDLRFDVIDVESVSCGISAGRAYCWGYGGWGGLGDGLLKGSGYPVPVAGG